MDEKQAEKELIGRVLAGDSRAVRELYSSVSRRLNRFFVSQVQTPEDVEELTQDTFLHFLDALPLFQFQSSLLTFILSIAKHELMDYWRKKYAKRVVRTVPLLNHLPSAHYSSKDTSIEIHAAMEKTYRQLKPAQTQLLKWKYEEGKSVKEIAAYLGLTVKAVEAQLYRARKAFQDAYVAPAELFIDE